MKKKLTILLVIALISCNPTVESILSNHLQPTANQNNKIKIGETIVFSYYEREGIDRSEYPAPTYSRIVDSNYFKKLKSQELNDGTDGGITTYFEIYEAIKSGETKIETFEILSTKVKTNDSIYFQKTKKKLGTYSFTIE
jgi:hypothetical protein